MGKWTTEERIQAVALAKATTVREAAAKLNIPLSTLGRWVSAVNNPDAGSETERDKVSKKSKEIAEELVEEAKEQVRDVVADQIKQLSKQMAEVNLAALNALKEAIEKGPGEDSNAQWVRALATVMAQGIDRQQLLEGKPTQRSEVITDDGDRKERVVNTIRNGFDEVRKALGLGSGHDDSGDGSGGAEETTH